MKDFLADMFTRIKNAQRVRLNSISLHPSTPKYCFKVLDILQGEGFIYGYQEWMDLESNEKTIKVILKYNSSGVPAINNIFRISSPGRRVYVSTKTLWKPKSTMGVFILSTPKGFYTDRDARFFNLGGELICGIY